MPLPAPLAALALAPALALPATAIPATSPELPTTTTTSAQRAATTLGSGHIDLAARITGGRLHLLVKDTTKSSRPVWRQPSTVQLRVPAAARTKVPAASTFRFLGRSGAPLWVLPQVQRKNLLWPGWSTQSLRPAQVRGPVAFTLSGVRGPGAFSLYTSGTFGQAKVLFDSGDRRPDRTSVPLGTHAHANWAFSKAGTYRLTFAMSATLRSGKQVSDTETVTVRVG